jgi:hypothetical protein
MSEEKPLAEKGPPMVENMKIADQRDIHAKHRGPHECGYLCDWLKELDLTRASLTEALALLEEGLDYPKAGGTLVDRDVYWARVRDFLSARAAKSSRAPGGKERE